MPDSLHLTTTLPARAEQVYRAWLDSTEHAAMTGSAAQIDPTVGGVFSAWDGYITGTNLELEPFQRIVQTWRTTEFPPGSPDSRLEVILEEVNNRTRLTLNHTDIPDGQGPDYDHGWVDFYFEPMRQYFSREA